MTGSAYDRIIIMNCSEFWHAASQTRNYNAKPIIRSMDINLLTNTTGNRANHSLIVSLKFHVYTNGNKHAGNAKRKHDAHEGT